MYAWIVFLPIAFSVIWLQLAFRALDRRWPSPRYINQYAWNIWLFLLSGSALFLGLEFGFGYFVGGFYASRIVYITATLWTMALPFLTDKSVERFRKRHKWIVWPPALLWFFFAIPYIGTIVMVNIIGRMSAPIEILYQDSSILVAHRATGVLAGPHIELFDKQTWGLKKIGLYWGLGGGAGWADSTHYYRDGQIFKSVGYERIEPSEHRGSAMEAAPPLWQARDSICVDLESGKLIEPVLP